MVKVPRVQKSLRMTQLQEVLYRRERPEQGLPGRKAAQARDADWEMLLHKLILLVQLGWLLQVQDFQQMLPQKLWAQRQTPRSVGNLPRTEIKMVKAKEQVPKGPRVQERARRMQLAKVLQGGELPLQGIRMLEARLANRVTLLQILVGQSPHLGRACLVGFSEALVVTAKELKEKT